MWHLGFRALLLSVTLSLEIMESTASLASNGTNDTTLAMNTNGSKDAIEFSCRWRDQDLSFSFGPGSVCGVCIVVGWIHLLFGYKLARTSMFMTGFTAGGLLGYLICIIKADFNLQINLLISGAVAILVGIVCGVVIFVGLFATGVFAGFSVAMAVLIGIVNFYQYENQDIVFGVILGSAALFAGLTVWFKRVFLIICSSILGGALVISGADYFVENFRMLNHVWYKVTQSGNAPKLCWFSYLVMGAWPLFTLIGLLVQFLKTGKKQPNKKGIRQGSMSCVPGHRQPAPSFVDELELELTGNNHDSGTYENDISV